MAVSLATVGPRVFITAVVGYCVWPSVAVMLSPPKPSTVVQPVEIAESLLSPKMVETTSRNVFLTKEAEEALAKAILDKAEKGATASGKPGTGGKKATVDQIKPPVNPLVGLKLEATYISGNSRLAVINGHVYGVKEDLPMAGNAATKVTIVDVRSEEVLLACEGQSFALTYSNVSSRGGAKGPAQSKQTKQGSK